MNKSRKPIYFLVFTSICFLAGIGGALELRELFTSKSLIETMLILVPPLYIALKYYSSSTIIKYQDEGYAPAKLGRLKDDILVGACTLIILPLCIDFLYACFLLFIIKWAMPGRLDGLAEMIYSVYLFNKIYIKKPLAILVILVSVLVLINIISGKILKKLGVVKKVIGVPIKLAATLLFFVSADSGITAEYTSWKINSEQPESITGGLTFNASTKDEAQIKGIVSEYVAYMSDQLAETMSATGIGDSSINAPALTNALARIALQWQSDPTILSDIYAGAAGTHLATVPVEERLLVNGVINREYLVNPKLTEIKPTNLYNAAYKTTNQERSSLLSILTDGRKAITKRVVTEEQKILEGLLVDFLGHTYLFKDVPKNIHLYAFAKDLVFDILKEKLTNGFFYLINKAKGGKINKADLSIVTDYVRKECKEGYAAAVSFIKTSGNALSGLSSEYGSAIKLKATLQAELETSAGMREYVRLFPHDQNTPLLEKKIPLYTYLENGEREALKEIDIDYLRSHIDMLPDDKKIALHKNMNALERAKNYEIAADAGNANALRDYLQQYPDDVRRAKIEERIAIYEETEIIDKVKRTGNFTELDKLVVRHVNDPLSLRRLALVRNGQLRMAELQTERLLTRNAAYIKPVITKTEYSFLKNLLKHLR